MRVLFALIVALAISIAANPVPSEIIVQASGDLQKAIDQAKPGDTILLEHGATFVGNFVLPARSGGDARIITLRTAGDDAVPAGDRMTPDAASPLAKLRSPNGSPALTTKPGTRGWRIALVEFQANRSGAGEIIALGDGSSGQRTLDQVPSDLTLDRLYIHGDRERGQKRGIALNSARTTSR